MCSVTLMSFPGLVEMSLSHDQDEDLQVDTVKGENTQLREEPICIENADQRQGEHVEYVQVERASS